MLPLLLLLLHEARNKKNPPNKTRTHPPAAVFSWLMDYDLSPVDAPLYFCLEERIYWLKYLGFDEDEFPADLYPQPGMSSEDEIRSASNYDRCKVVGREIVTKQNGQNVEVLLVRNGRESILLFLSVAFCPLSFLLLIPFHQNAATLLHFAPARVKELLSLDYTRRLHIKPADRLLLQRSYGGHFSCFLLFPSCWR